MSDPLWCIAPQPIAGGEPFEASTDNNGEGEAKNICINILPYPMNPVQSIWTEQT